MQCLLRQLNVIAHIANVSVDTVILCFDEQYLLHSNGRALMRRLIGEFNVARSACVHILSGVDGEMLQPVVSLLAHLLLAKNTVGCYAVIVHQIAGHLTKFAQCSGRGRYARNEHLNSEETTGEYNKKASVLEQ